MKTRLLTEEQINGSFLKEASSRRVREQLSRWRASGLLNRSMARVTPLEVAAPIFSWRRGKPAPDCHRISWRLERRWTRPYPQCSAVYWATSRLARRIGGRGGRLMQPLQVQHDVGVAAVYCLFLQDRPEEADRWIGEDQYRRLAPKRIPKVPDAVVLGADGRIERAIEFGGRYSARRLRSLHRAFERRGLPYEIY